MNQYRVRNWDKFQHFKDRRPPWIKLHRDILEQRDINAISDCAFRVLVGVWLLASEDKDMRGTLPAVDDIAFRLRLSKQAICKALQELAPFLIQDDINAISTRYQVDEPETETETETKAEKETDTPKPPRGIEYSVEFLSFWNVYPNKKGKKAAWRAWQRAKDRPPIEALLTEVRLQCRSQEWAKDGGQYIPHPATWINRGGWDDCVKPI